MTMEAEGDVERNGCSLNDSIYMCKFSSEDKETFMVHWRTMREKTEVGRDDKCLHEDSCQD